MALIATPGRSVHYVMKDGSMRPLLIVHVFPNEAEPHNPMVNGHLALDGENDRDNDPGAQELDKTEEAPLVRWATSVSRNDEKQPGTWHWPERV